MGRIGWAAKSVNSMLFNLEFHTRHILTGFQFYLKSSVHTEICFWRKSIWNNIALIPIKSTHPYYDSIPKFCSMDKMLIFFARKDPQLQVLLNFVYLWPYMLSCNVLLFFDKKPNNNETSQSIGMVFTCVVFASRFCATSVHCLELQSSVIIVKKNLLLHWLIGKVIQSYEN